MRTAVFQIFDDGIADIFRQWKVNPVFRLLLKQANPVMLPIQIAESQPDNIGHPQPVPCRQ